MKLMEKLRSDWHTDDELVSSMERRMLPSVLVEQASGVFLSFANLVIMGMVSGAALAGVGQVSTVNNAVMYFFSYFAMGGTVMVAQHMGEKREDLAKASLFNSLLFGLVFTCLLTAAMVIFRSEIIGGLFGAADQEVLESSISYFLYSSLATPFWFIYYQVGGILRSSGDAKTPMMISIVLNGLALVFNIVFVLILQMGSMGSGLATFLSVFLAASIGFACLFRKNYQLNLRSLKGIRPSLRQIREIVGIGLPSAIENLMMNGGKVVVSSIISSMGTAMISAYQVCMSALNVVTVPLNAYIAMVVPIIGHLAGRREKSRTVAALRYLNRKTVWINSAVALILLFLPAPLCLLYTRDAETLFISVALCMIYSPSFFFSSYYMVIPAGFKGVKDVTFSMIVGTVFMWVFRVGLGYFLGVTMGLQCYGIMIGMLVDSLARSAVIAKRFYGDRWLRHMDWKPEEAPSPVPALSK